MSDATFITCTVSGGADLPRILSFSTRNDWLVDSLRRIGKVIPLAAPLQVLAVQRWQQERQESFGGSYAAVTRSHDFASPAELLALADAIDALIEACMQNADDVAYAISRGRGEYVREAVQARGVRGNFARESVGGEDGEGYEFLFDVLETVAALARSAAAHGRQLRWESERSADWD